MALDPKSKDALTRFTILAQKIIYNSERMKHFMQMLGTTNGAVTAVQSVLAAIEKRKHIPPELLPILGVNIYVVMVDVAQAATKVKPDPGIMNNVIKTIQQKLTGVSPTVGKQPPKGIIGSAMQGAPA